MSTPRSRHSVRPIAAVVVLLGLVFGGGFWLLRQAGAPRAEFLPRPAVFERDFVKSEETFDRANASVKGSFVRGLKSRDWGEAARGLTADFRARFPARGGGREVPDGAVALREYGGEGLPDLEGPAFLAVLRGHVDDWAAVERTTWRPFEFLLEPGDRSAWVNVHFQVAGVKPDGLRADLSGTVRAGLVTADGKEWRLRRLEWVDGVRAEARTAPWVDITEPAGLTFNESAEVQRLRQEMINDRGIVNLGGLVVADFDRDGFPDVLATRENNQAVLFRNDGRGGFVRATSPVATAKEVGLTFLLVDLDGDGVEELVSTRVTEYEGETAWLPIHVRRGDGWEARPRALEVRLGRAVRGIQTQSIEPVDIDADGDLDLFFCNYSNNESNGPRFNRISSHDGQDNWLFVNQGGLRFREESGERGIAGTQFTYVAKAWDFDGDGDPDIFEGNDYGPNHLWVNDGKGRFQAAKDHIFAADSNYTMGVTIADWDNTGRWSMNISNMYSHAGNRIVPLAADLGPEMRRLGLILAQGNQFYEQEGGVWSETGIARGVNWADWAWSCLFFDAENDGDRDLFVANGYTTHEDAKAPDY